MSCRGECACNYIYDRRRSRKSSAPLLVVAHGKGLTVCRVLHKWHSAKYMFAVCYTGGTRQKGCLTSAHPKVTTGSVPSLVHLICRVFLFTVYRSWHKSNLAVCIFFLPCVLLPNTRQKCCLPKMLFAVRFIFAMSFCAQHTANVIFTVCPA